MKKLFKIVAITLLVLVVVLLLLAVNSGRIIGWLATNETVVAYLTDFQPSENYQASVAGAYPVAACHNSHANWGESVRRTLSLSGEWEVEQGVMGDTPPAQFGHRAQVPGFLTEATPPFTEVGMASDQRDVFWYRYRFQVPLQGADQAFICLHKAKYGVKVWLNGIPLGEHFGAFTLSEYNAGKAIRYGEQNELIVRLGADRGQVPAFIPAGADTEKDRWYPGLWDSVSLVLTGPVSLATVKIEPDIDRGRVVVKSTLHNGSSENHSGSIIQHVTEWESGAGTVNSVASAFTLAAGASTVVEQVFELPDARLWSPESPFLYLAHSQVDIDGHPADDRATRFGMRKVEWKGGEGKGFYLNNRLYYLRGTNIALHRFFDDPQRKHLPWDEAWVRQLLGGYPKQFHWNSFRPHNGRLPNLWYDLADEIGLIIADEYNFWSPMIYSESKHWSIVELEKEFRGWITENWNHPAIGWWDSSNENHNLMSGEVIRRVRQLDSTRQWENGGYEAPDAPGDPIEEHPYKLNSGGWLNANKKVYTMADFDAMDGQPVQSTWGAFATYDAAMDHPFINNEYAWLWLTRLGKPTPLGAAGFNSVAPDQDLNPQEAREAYAYLVSEISAFWRAQRGYAGVQHFVYLSKCIDEESVPAGWEIRDTSATCDNFIDIPELVLEPRWARYARSAFAPLMVYIRNWSQAFYQRGVDVSVPVILLNDTYVEQDVTLELLAVLPDGKVAARSGTRRLSLGALARVEQEVDIKLPEDEQIVLYAELRPASEDHGTVWSIRKLGYPHPGAAIPDPPFSSAE